jgi:opacity protein-like surface antigen
MKSIALICLISAYITGQASTPTFAADPINFYLGGSVGESEIKLGQTEAGNPVDFDEHQLGWKVIAGVRPISIVGAEVEYFDVGHPSAAVNSPNFGPPAPQVDIRMHGVAAFAVGYLPLPVPFVDIYGKAGVARLHSSISDSYSGPSTLIIPCAGGNLSCGGGSYSQSDTDWAWGIGSQIRLSDTGLHVRAEYERFTAVGEHPYLLSLGLTWVF